MKKNFLKLLIVSAYIGVVGMLPDVVMAASYTHTFYNTTNLVFTSSVDTHTMDPRCDGSSPASYTWSLSVNGSSISGTQTCTPLEPGPSGLTATPQACSTGQNYLDWDDSPGAVSYSVYLYPTGWIGNSIGSNFTHTGSVSSSYKYYVRSNNSLGVQSADSGYVTAVTAAACPSPVVTLSASPTALSPGNSSTLTWTVSEAATCTASGGWSGSKASSGGTESVSPTVTTTYNLSCTGPGGTTAATPVTVTHPSGFISASPCTINPVGMTEGVSCESLVSWGSFDFVGGSDVLQGTTSFSGDTSGSQLRTVTPDNHSFTLRDAGGTFIASAAAVVSCGPDTVWVPETASCAFLPVVTINSDSNLIRSGATLDFEILIDSNLDLTCTVRDGGTPEVFSHSGASTTQAYTETTRSLRAAQIINVTCVSSLYPAVSVDDEIRVEVVPTVQEI